jgi:hypothetical protein
LVIKYCEKGSEVRGDNQYIDEREREREREEWPDISCYNLTTSILATKGHVIAQRE